MHELVNKLKQHNVKISVVGENLELDFPDDFDSDSIIQEIRENKQALISYIEKANWIREEIPQAKHQKYYRLSNAQRRLWIIDQLADDKGIYNVPLGYSFQSLNVEAFNNALIDILDRHEILRTTINIVEGEPHQYVHDIKDFPFELIKLKAESQEEVEEMLRKEIFYQFDLTKSAVRAVLIECSDGSFDFIFLLHHIVTDAWSMNVLQKDFLALYHYHDQGKPLGLPALRIHYKDYTLWQHEQIKQGHLSHSRDYWIKKFQGEIPSLKLPLDFRREKSDRGKGGEVSFSINSETVKKLDAIANDCGASFFMAMVAVTNVLLYRYTGQEDIILGSPVSGRNHPELENQVGFYSNTIVLRSSVHGANDFRELLSKVSRGMLESYEHQFYPYDLLVDDLELGRDMTRNPLFDVMVSLNNAQDKENDEDNHFEEFRIIKAGPSKFDLSYAFRKMPDNVLHININYNSGLFRQEKILRMAGHLKNLIAEISENPGIPVMDIEYLSKDEENQILNVFNDTKEDYNLDTSIKNLIEKQAEKSPGEIFLLSNDRNITFGDFNIITNQLAGYLKENHNVKKGDHIGIILETGINRIIALIAVLKLGAVCVPVDPLYPEDSRQYIINDAQLNVLITENQDQKSDQYSVVLINEIIDIIKNYPTDNIHLDCKADDILTILYTSDLSENPGGVVIRNISFVNSIHWLWNTYQLGNNDVIYQKAAFDVSIGELFMTLCFGAKFVVAPGETAQDIIKNISHFKVTHLHFSPRVLNAFVELGVGDIKKLTALKYVFTSGGELSEYTVKSFYSKFDIPLINLYGPTEASLKAGSYETKSNDDIIPIGKPIANVNLYIMDANYKLLPIGIPGEIGIAGVGLAKGYLNQERISLEKFIPHPYQKDKQAQIYKTGDIGLWNEQGEIEFLGKKNNQINISGLIIKPEEIENEILEHPEVQDVAVLVNQDDFKNNHLIAYYVKRPILTTVQTETLTPVTHNYREISESIPHPDGKVNMKIHRWFEKCADENPDQTALIFGNTTMTYKELNGQANHLAGILIDNYLVKGNDFVGIIMERSEKMIISILAALKAGAAYIPVDAEYPDARVQTILEDSAPTIILSDQKNRVRKVLSSRNCVVFEEIEKDLQREFYKENRIVEEENDICYICYTSGSTGTPKGVMIGQDSVSDYITTFTDYFKITEKDTVIQQASISFDTAVEEIFPILCSGGRLIIMPDGGRDINAIINAVNDYKVSVISTTPLVLNEINIKFNDLTHLPRIIISGGDELRPSYISRILQKTLIYNTYGPTETTVCATFAQINDVSECNIIGLPIADHEIYLLDDSLQKVSEGNIGEIFIAGPGVAKGYLNNQKETKKRFLNNSFDGGIFYRTGDMARRNKKGLLEFCGRKDMQVKIRGYRVEPAEIDMALKDFDGIISCITTSKADFEGNKHLITYYTSGNELNTEDIRLFLTGILPQYMVPDYFIQLESFSQTINGKIKIEDLPVPYALILDKRLELELRDFIKKKLPLHMIPAYFVNLEKLPVTATGKIDRKMLENKNPFFIEKQAVVAPKNAVEMKILQIWEDCLQYPVKSTHINFFKIGGNSIKATQILARLFKEFNCDITLKDIFNNPTVGDLSQFIMRNTSDRGLTVKLNNIHENLPDMYFIPPIIGSSTIFRNIASALDGIYSIYGIQYKGFDYDEPFDNSIYEMARTGVAEIIKTNNHKKISILGYSMGVPIAFEMTKILESMDYEIDLVFIDRGAFDEIQNQSIEKEHVNEILELELNYWLKEIRDTDTERIKSMVFNNLQILSRYKIEGTVNADILAIEASENGKGTQMESWQTYTFGDFKHFYVPTDHYGILIPENSKKIVEFINT